MAFVRAGGGPLDYFPCRYGRSRLLFRGPKRDLSRPFVAFLGGTETFGKYVPLPFPALCEAGIGMVTVNLGVPQAGPDAFLNDPATLGVAQQAVATVVQVTAAQNVTNRFYAVHPRRNDRFLKATPLMQALFREVDFTEFAFTRHMVHGVARIAPAKFGLLVDEVRSAWLARMQALLSKLPEPTVLLWLSDCPPAPTEPLPDLRTDPLTVDAAMIAALRPHVSRTVEVVASSGARSMGTAGMCFPAHEEAAAMGLPGPAIHREAAAALMPVLRELLDLRTKQKGAE